MEADTFLKQANALDSIAASVHSCIAAAPPATQSVLLQSIILTGGRAKKIGADLETVIRAKAGGPVTVVTSSDPRLDVLVGGERFAALRCAHTYTHTELQVTFTLTQTQRGTALPWRLLSGLFQHVATAIRS